jgi:hypothetical protein
MKNDKNNMNYLFMAMVLITISPGIFAQQPRMQTIAEESSDADEAHTSNSTSPSSNRQLTTSSTESNGSGTKSDSESSRSNTPTPPSKGANAASVYADAPIDNSPLPIPLVHERAVESLFKKYLAIINENPNQNQRQKLLENFFNVTVPMLYKQYIAQHFNHTSKMNKYHNADAYKLAVAAQKGFKERWGFNIFKKVDERFRQEYKMKPIKDYKAFFIVKNAHS